MLSAIQNYNQTSFKGWSQISPNANNTVRKLNNAINDGLIKTKVNRDGWIETLIEGIKITKKRINENICFVFEKNGENNKLFDNKCFIMAPNIDAKFETITTHNVRELNPETLLTEKIAPALDKLA